MRENFASPMLESTRPSEGNLKNQRSKEQRLAGQDWARSSELGRAVTFNREREQNLMGGADLKVCRKGRWTV